MTKLTNKKEEVSFFIDLRKSPDSSEGKVLRRVCLLACRVLGLQLQPVMKA